MRKSLILIIALALFTSFAPHKELKWMAIGDSITFHNGKPEYTKGRITKGYMDDVVTELPYVHFANHGHPGWTAKGIAENFDNLGIEKADIYSVFLGTNDWWVGFPIGAVADYDNNTGAGTVYGAYRIIIDKIRAQNSDAAIILLTPMQRTDYVDINNQASIIHGAYKENNDGVKLSDYADAVKNIARLQNLKLADLYYESGITIKNAVNYKRLKDPTTGEYKNYKYPDYVGIPFNPKTDEYPYPIEAMNMTYDGLHPTDKGHAIIAKMLVKIMKQY
ncbi:MAG: SGNH/GDSL hydrolase family protein [Mucilaginibacter sp.]|nr:SGNH/GDSL hydrolase family protein [Mucilaginibacter sp.]